MRTSVVVAQIADGSLLETWRVYCQDEECNRRDVGRDYHALNVAYRAAETHVALSHSDICVTPLEGVR